MMGDYMRTRFDGLYLSAATAVLGMMCSIAPVAAQSAGSEPPAASGGIEEVTVTATRREEKLSKVPESISAFTAEKIDQLDVKNISDLVHYTPGVTYDPESKDISIRGVNSTAGDATTGIYIDDTPIQLRALGFGSDNTLPAVFDLDRVEILRGPQGTLFGAGSEGGTVRYITPRAKSHRLQRLREERDRVYGRRCSELRRRRRGWRPDFDDQLGFRLSAWGRRDGGWIDKVNYMTGATERRIPTVSIHMSSGARCCGSRRPN